MFSKNHDEAAIRLPLSRTWSITARLTALFTIAALLLLFLVITVLYQAIEKHLEEEHEHLLAEIIRVLRQGHSASAFVEQVSNIAVDEPASYSDPYTLRVLDEQNRVVAESRGMARIPIDAFGGAPAASSGHAAHARRWSSADGEEFLLATIDAGAGNGSGTSSIVQVALNVTRDRVLMRELRVTAAFLLGFGLLASALAAAVVVRHGLRPIAEITAEVAEISAEQLQRRLSVATAPRELTTLVDAFNRMLDRLDRAFAALSQYSANLAHELRTPLNNLQGEAEVALLQARGAEEYREVLMSSLEEYERLSNMIDHLLFLARADNREMKPAWSTLSLAAEARAVNDFYAALADEKRISLDIQGDVSVEIDSVLFRRALGNLVANSLRYVPNGGQVTIDIARTTGAGAIVRVIDDGSGIPAADLPRVLERFYRGSQSRGEGVVGSGLGLAIVKSIMDLHGGNIDVASAIGRGTTITLQFPATH